MQSGISTACGQGLEMLIEPFLHGLVVVRADHQRRVGPGLGGPAGQPQGLFGAVRAGAGHNLDAAGRRLDDGRDDPLVFGMRERGRFAGRAHGANARRARRHLKFHLLLQGFDIHLPVAEGRDQSDGKAGKVFGSGHVEGS